jgi:biotin carboxyl carrier protein
LRFVARGQKFEGKPERKTAKAKYTKLSSDQQGKIIRTIEVRFPRLDPDMEYGSIGEWLKKEGEMVEKGEPLATIETEKVVTDIEAPVKGILSKILMKEGSRVKVGEVIALIEERA